MQIIQAIHALMHRFQIPVKPGMAIDRFVYSYLLAGETITLIDTGVAGCERTISEYIRSPGLPPLAVTPLLARTIAADIRIGNSPGLVTNS